MLNNLKPKILLSLNHTVYNTIRIHSKPRKLGTFDLHTVRKNLSSMSLREYVQYVYLCIWTDMTPNQ